MEQNNTPDLSIVRSLFVASSAAKKTQKGALQGRVLGRFFLKGCIFDQVVVVTVTYDCNKCQILLSCAVVTSKTENR